MRLPRRAFDRPPTDPAPGLPVVFDDAFLHRLERLMLRAQHVTSSAGGRPGTFRTPAADFIDHRPYSPGDDTRHIDWPAAARHDALFVKVGRAPQAAEVHLLLDISKSMAAVADKWRLALELTAALGWMSVARGDRLSVVPFPATEQVPWGPASGAGQGVSLLSYLSGLRPVAAPATTLEPVVRQAVQPPAVGGLVVIVSDLWVTDDVGAALGRAPPPRWEVLLLQLLAPGELVPTLGGALQLTDAESEQQLTVVVDSRVRSRYRRALSRHLERLQRLAARHGANYVLLPTDWPLERAVIPYLRRRMVLT